MSAMQEARNRLCAACRRHWLAHCMPCSCVQARALAPKAEAEALADALATRPPLATTWEGPPELGPLAVQVSQYLHAGARVTTHVHMACLREDVATCHHITADVICTGTSTNILASNNAGTRVSRAKTLLVADIAA